MRRRKNKRSDLVFAVALLCSVLLHAVLGVPARTWLNQYLSSRSTGRPPPVKLVRVSQQQWNKNRQFRRRANRRATAAQQRPKPKPQPPKPKPKPQDTKLKGQIVELPPTPDNSPNPDAKYLSKYNTNVKKESVARYEERDRRRKRVTSRLQTRKKPPPKREQARQPSKQPKGDELEAKKPGTGRGKNTDKGDFVLELPSQKKKRELKLRLSELPGVSQARQQRGREEMRGNGKRYRLELGGSGEGETAGGKKGRKDGGDKKPLPTLEQLQPTIGTIARISGSPSNDYVEGVPEGDATFLNAKEFKYATFFYRVKDSVGNIWYDMVIQELRRRDPTGKIYGPRDRATMLTVRIDLDGRLADVSVANSSGVQFLDEVAVQAFKMAEPFPNPPSAMADPDGYIKFNFQFVMLRSRGPLNLFKFR